MKVVWCDDKSNDPAELESLADEWFLEEREVLPAKDDDDVLKYLKEHQDIRLLIMDLLFAQPEDDTVMPLGIRYLERIRRHYPDLRVVTRSIVSKPGMLGSLYQHLMSVRVQEHFFAHDDHPSSKIRRRLLVESMKSGSQGPGMLARSRSLREYVGDQWGVVLFADVSGFTLMTEQLWQANKAPLCTALNSFYDMCIEVVRREGGVIDKFVGDELMALFFVDGNRNQSEVADAAVSAAKALLARFRELARQFHELLADDVEWREIKWRLKIGLEAGAIRIIQKAISSDELEYCSIGHAINLAARLKGIGGDYSIAVGPNLKRYATGKYEYTKFGGEVNLKNIRGSVPVQIVTVD